MIFWLDVDYFILVESDRTFRGTPKPLYYKENEQRFSKYKDRIIYVKCPLDQYGTVEETGFNKMLLNTSSEEYKTVWKRERATKDCIKQGLVNSISPQSTYLLISDV